MSGGDGAKVGHALHRSHDPRAAVDILSHYDVAMIVENTDAEGYVSEKLYDALIAGCLPAYYGVPGPRLRAHLGLPPGMGPRDAASSAPGVPWLDLTKFRDGAEVQAWLAARGPDGLAALRAEVLRHRHSVLAAVDCAAFAQAARRAIARASSAKRP